MGATRCAVKVPGSGWIVGWTLGAASVAVAAGLLVSLILLARKVAHEAADIADGLESVERNTAALPALASANTHLSHALGSLRVAARQPS